MGVPGGEEGEGRDGGEQVRHRVTVGRLSKGARPATPCARAPRRRPGANGCSVKAFSVRTGA